MFVCFRRFFDSNRVWVEDRVSHLAKRRLADGYRDALRSVMMGDFHQRRYAFRESQPQPVPDVTLGDADGFIAMFAAEPIEV